ncbi:hypothetical protein E2C01_015155 [Portunus trituberculatus]|uniref:Uncharacterized protein n=1 Tax=Portunus trituberculatus TaxID=210409 RepID=A0A5B7DL33_PORTR|nr:hypothetical protein [Portunus trituberculatus]
MVEIFLRALLPSLLPSRLDLCSHDHHLPHPSPATLAAPSGLEKKNMILLNLFCFVTTFEFARSQDIPLHVIKTRITHEHVLVSFPVVPCVASEWVPVRGYHPSLRSSPHTLTTHPHHAVFTPPAPPPPRSSSPRSFRVGYSVESRSPLPRWRAEGSYII